MSLSTRTPDLRRPGSPLMKIFLSILVPIAIGCAILIHIRTDGRSHASKEKPFSIHQSASEVTTSFPLSQFSPERPETPPASGMESASVKSEETPKEREEHHPGKSGAPSRLTLRIPGKETTIRNPIPRPPSAPPSSPFPAIWIELPGSLSLEPSQQSRIQQDAETLLEQIKAAEESDVPETTKAELINASDLDFRRKYGVRAWLSHHAQARALFGSTNGK